MIIVIHYGDAVLKIAGKLTQALKEMQQLTGFEQLETIEKSKLNAFIQRFKGGEIANALILYPDIDAAKEAIFSAFKVIYAAGGIVQNDKKELLFIFRRGKWDLPKGKLDAGELPADAAEREIKEETGIDDLQFKYKVGDTYHIYSDKDQHILKVSSWYYFTLAGRGKPKAQVEEQITEVKWFPTRNIKEPMLNTYETIREILHRFFDTP